MQSTVEIGNAYDLVAGKVETWVELFIQMLPNLVVAMLVIIAFYVLSKVVRNLINKLLNQVTDNKTIIHLLDSIVSVSIIGVGIFIALGILNLDDTVTTLLAGAGIIGLALGFAFQDIASNFISGVILSIRHPFGVGDIISSNDYFGTVQKLNLRNTIIKTPQGQVIYIPNKNVFENPLENFSSTGERRIDLSCGVSYGDDLEKAKTVALEAINEVEMVNQQKEPEFYFDEFGDSSINFKLRFWISFKSNKEFWNARSEAIMKLKTAFDEADIMIPFPIRTLDFGIRGGEGLDTVWSEKSSQSNGAG
jgi:small conductance mechanosensitive channel